MLPMGGMLMTRSLALAGLVVLAGGCQVILGINDVEPIPDEVDCEPVGNELDCETWAAVHFDACELCAPLGPLSLGEMGTYTYDTDSGELRAPNGDLIRHAASVLEQTVGDAWVISVDGFALEAGVELRAIGLKPLIIASWSAITIEGVLDVGSELEVAEPGAGVDLGCGDSPAVEGVTGDESGSGGGGGGFKSQGGNGGPADSSGNQLQGGEGGGNISTPDQVRGGCSGARGGHASPVGMPRGGVGGRGGGAIQLSARDAIEVTGTIAANGSGGEQGYQGLGRDGSGGGGGGSGGYIGLDTPTLSVIDAVLVANGGGGGEGGDFDEDGKPGENGLRDAISASGGALCANAGGNGGDGGSRPAPQGETATQEVDGGGGGGGGGVGHIVIDVTNIAISNSTISPQEERR